MPMPKSSTSTLRRSNVSFLVISYELCDLMTLLEQLARGHGTSDFGKTKGSKMSETKKSTKKAAPKKEAAKTEDPGRE